MANPTTLVTGGAGFLGSHLCESLLNEGYHVVCLDNFGSGRVKNIKHLHDHSSFELIEGDVRELKDFPAVEQIYHLASRASPADFTRYPVRIALTNTEGTRNLLDHAKEQDIRMVYASTSEVYGDPEEHPQSEEYAGNVNIRGPRGCYDESKRFGETLAVAYETKWDVDVRTARIFNTYGPRMRSDDGRVVPTFVTQVLTEEDLTVYGDGSQTRSFCYVEDMIRGLRALMESDGLKGDVVNLGQTNELSIQALAENILNLVNTSSEITYEPLPDDDPKRRCPDITKAKRVLEWEPTVQLEQGLTETIEYFRTHE